MPVSAQASAFFTWFGGIRIEHSVTLESRHLSHLLPRTSFLRPASRRSPNPFKVWVCRATNFRVTFTSVPIRARSLSRADAGSILDKQSLTTSITR